MTRTTLYKRIVLGGTFDHFHIGHQKLLRTVLEKAETVSLGITLPELYQHKALAEEIESYEIREKIVMEFLKAQNALDLVTITPINDMYGTTLNDKAIDAIVVTPATEKNAGIVNAERRKQDMPKLPIIVVPLVKGDDDRIISSERIRRGEIDREGTSYRKFFLNNDLYTLPHSLRETLQQPFGKIVTDAKDLASILRDKPIISVGDVVSLTLLKTGYTPVLCVIDYKTERQKIEKSSVSEYFQESATHMTNPAGTISKETLAYYDSACHAYNTNHKTQTIIVDGEEDLLALPLMLAAPLGTKIVYGLKDVGMIIVTVTEKLKEEIKQLLRQF